ncbi:four-helix bundle copper-binding protein [Deinococcus oregonensis]|uniref:Four-helix bundle copper-binding protein n=1 Tax=Deinococcus oregonensis TaxID=1805970 RepID=A0ABV6ATP8_9DEIO
MTPAIQDMFATHPRQDQVGSNLQALTTCIEACFECAQVCTSCADACLGEHEHLMHLVRCIRLNLDCADICATTGKVLARLTETNTEVVRAQVPAGLSACRAWGNECEAHARDMNMAQCRICAESCRRCEHACQQLLDGMGA